jgi:hypothetical protein
MDRTDVADLFTKVGSTASQIARGGAQRYRAVGEFSIGALSYFLASDEYELHTRKEGQEPLGLAFMAAMLDGRSQARELSPARDEIGTTLILHAKSPDLFDLLRNKFSHWMRNVQGLRARLLPDDVDLSQGGLTRELWARVDNVTNTDYETGGAFNFNVFATPVVVQRFVAPGAPVAAWAGARVSF